MKYHYIYKITQKKTGAYYMGRHTTKNLNDGYFGSGTLISALVDMLGKDDFVKEILEFLPNYNELKAREKEIVNEDLLKDPLCLNKQLGGEGGGGFWNEEHSKKFLEAGKQGLANKWKTDEEFIEKMKAHSSRNFKLRHKEGKLKHNSFLGKKHSLKTKQKISKTHKEKGIGVGDKNSQYDTLWVVNKVLLEEKKIKKEYFNRLETDWELGRLKDFKKLRIKEQEKEEKILKQQLKRELWIKQLEDWYIIYREVGFKKFVEITGYDKSVQNLSQIFKAHVKDFNSQQGKKKRNAVLADMVIAED